MPRFDSRLGLLPIFACLTASAFAAEADTPEAKHTASVRFLAVTPLGAEPLFYRSGAEYKPLTAVSTDFLGLPVRLSWGAKENPALYRKNPAAKAGDDKQPAFVPAITWKAADAKRQIVLILPRPAGTVAAAASDNEGDFPFGRYRVYNFSKKALTFDFGGASATFKPGESALMPVAKKVDNGLVFVRGAYATDKAWQPFVSTCWTSETDSRTFLFVFDDPAGKSVQMRGVPDVNNPALLEAKAEEDQKPPRGRK